MAEPIYIDWDGKSGREYRYWIYEIGTTFSKNPGNYIFAKEVKPLEWSPVYIGQTGDLSERLDNHHKMPCIKRRGATHIHIHTGSQDEDTRLAEEKDLALRWHPACND
jgi:predicted GIY-YIG superfamily endonuclease